LSDVLEERIEEEDAAAVSRATSTRFSRRSMPTNSASVPIAPTRQNFPTPEPTSRIRVAPACVSSSAARAATATGVQCRLDRTRIGFS
jgi:hypothetical protein